MERKTLTTKSILRCLCALVDFIVVLLPVQFVLMGVFNIPVANATFLFQMLFIAYNVIFITTTRGQSPGKMIGKMMVNDSCNDKLPIMYTGLRELMKSIYFVPYVGWGLCIVSIIMMFVNGKAIHDYVGRTVVLFLWEKKRLDAEKKGEN